MDIEDQVLTIEQMSHLKELGVEVKDTAIVWDYNEPDWASAQLSNTYFDEDLKNCVPTLTLQEILALLPKGHIRYKDDHSIALFEKNAKEISIVAQRDRFDNTINLLDAAYNMLCWVAEHGYLNQRK